MEIDLPIWIVDGCLSHWEVVEAELVDVAPHITVGTFAVHRSVAGGRWPWTCSNIETGNSVGYGYFRDDAIVHARHRLAELTDTDIEKAYAAISKDILRSKA